MKAKRILSFIISLTMIWMFFVPVHAQNSYRFLALGDSLTLHYPVDGQWYNTCGMAASTPEKDWVHQVAKNLKTKYGDVTMEVQNTTW